MHFFRVAVIDGETEAAELNRLLESHRIATIDRQFVAAGAESFWAIAVAVVGGGVGAAEKRRPRIDYKEVFSPADFEVSSKRPLSGIVSCTTP